MRRLSVIVFGGGILLAGTLHAQDLPAGDPARGEALMPSCRTCHGADGVAKLLVAPNIAGEPESYLAAQLVAYRDGERQNEMMSVVAKALSDQDIADLAAWYAAPSVTASVPGDPADAPAVCVSCHGADGIATVEGVPHLAGDPEMYLTAQLKAYRDSTRVHETMSAIAAPLEDGDIKAAARWFSSLSLAVE